MNESTYEARQNGDVFQIIGYVNVKVGKLHGKSLIEFVEALEAKGRDKAII